MTTNIEKYNLLNNLYYSFPNYILLFIAFLYSTNISSSPILRIEVGQHTAMINRMAIDKSGKLLATASDDKTVRLWNLPDGSLYTILRVPIDEQLKGALYAVAISPDGKTVIASGETIDETNKFSLYVFDVEQRILKARISNIPSAIYHLAYSKDGRFFAAALAGGYGIRVWDSQTGKIVAQDNDYGERCTWLDFSVSGLLTTASHDGFIRIYDNKFSLIKKSAINKNKTPNSVSFSSNGQRIAVGFSNIKQIAVLDLDLNIKALLSIRELEGRNAAIVAWKQGSNTELYSSGDMHTINGDFIIRHWHDVNTPGSIYEDIKVSQNIVTDIITLQNHVENKFDTLFSSADPAWGALLSNQLVLKNQAKLWNARLLSLTNKTFLLSSDGLKVAFSESPAQNNVNVFNVENLVLSKKISQAQNDLFSSITENTKVKLTNWRDDEPKLNGKPLLLEQYEKILSYAIDPKTNNLLIGTNYNLRLYSSSGNELKKILMPAEVNGINIAMNSNLAVCALSDGTIRWYSLSQNEYLSELISLFNYDNGNNWIIWTKEGFFASSDNGGYRLAGYHINHGENKRPEWIEFSQLYQNYYAPELILQKVLRKEDKIQEKIKALDTIDNNLSNKPTPIINLIEYCVSPDHSKDEASTNLPTDNIAINNKILNTPYKWINKVNIFIENFSKNFTTAPKQTNDQIINNIKPTCYPILGQGKTKGFKRKDLGQATAYRNQLQWSVDTIDLHYSVKFREGGIGDIDIYDNGQIQYSEKINKAYSIANQELNLNRAISLKKGENEIVVHAYDKSGGTAGISNSLVLLNPEQTTTDIAGMNRSTMSSDGSKLIIFAIGIDRYQSPNQLRYAVKDASDFAQTVITKKSSIYSSAITFELFDENATLYNIERTFDKIKSIINKNDSVLVYLSGHGIRENNEYYFIPFDVDNNNFSETALSQRTLKRNIAKLSKSNKVFIFLDSCHSGAVDANKIQEDVTDFDKIKHQLGDGVFVLAAAGDTQEAQDQFQLSPNEIASNGLFAYAVLEGINGKARRIEDNIVDSYNLGSYVQRRIDTLTKNQTLYKQKARFQLLDAGDILSFDISQYE